MQLRRDYSVGPGSPAPGPPFRSPACLLTQTPHLRSSLAQGPVHLQPQPPGRCARLLPPLGFKLKFPGWGRQRTRRASPAPSRRKPLPRPRRTRPRRGNPLGPRHAPALAGVALPTGFARSSCRVPQARRISCSQSCRG